MSGGEGYGRWTSRAVGRAAGRPAGAGGGGGVVQAEVVPVEEVVGRDVIEAETRGRVAVPAEHAAHHEVHNQATDRLEELRHRHDLAVLVPLLDDGVLAVRLQRRPRRGPHEVGTPDPRIPVLVEPLRGGVHTPRDRLSFIFDTRSRYVYSLIW